MVDERFFEEDGGQFQDIEGMQPLRNVPYPFPLPLPRASGLYEWKKQRVVYPHNAPQPAYDNQMENSDSEMMAGQQDMGHHNFEGAAIYPWWFGREELRLDVDGRYPQMTASGTVIRDFRSRVEWIAQLSSQGNNHWSGAIWFKDGNANSFPYTNVDIKVTRSWFSNQRAATATFSGGGVPRKLLKLKYKSPCFRRVEFEYDSTSDSNPIIKVNTVAHPNMPATLPSEELSISKVFRRAGFDVRKSGDDDTLPASLSGPNGTWSDMEMHDAMQAYWSRFSNRAQWSMWVLFAKMHDRGNGLGGIMFDDIGPNHRQGTAIFTDSFIANSPGGETHPDAWVKRMRFWTAVHEMGHSFNLAHSWQKALGTSWIPLNNEPEARSFMNYPYNVSGGQSAFFSDFEYRFSDSELLFMRHAPERFVQMGNADWFDHHGFRNANFSAEPTYQLIARVNRDITSFEFMEPVIVEMKLTNISGQAQLIDKNILATSENLTVIIKKDGKPARQFLPYAQYCERSANMALNSEDSVYDSFLISVGRNGWDMAEPGNYTVQLALHFEEQDVVSNPLRVKIAPPKAREEEYLAQDFFSDDVGRVLTFSGSHYLESANNTLLELTDRFGTSRASIHARLALANGMARDYKMFEMPKSVNNVLRSAQDLGMKVKTIKPDKKQSRKFFKQGLMDIPDHSAETFGHIRFKKFADNLCSWLIDRDDMEQAEKLLEMVHDTLHSRNVLKTVLNSIDKQHKQIAKKVRAA